MFSFKLGLKNLTRQKRRNIITIFVIAFAFFGYLFMDSVMGGMEEMSFSNIKNYDTGNIQVMHPEYWEDREKLSLENLIYINQDTIDSIKNIDVEISGLLNSPNPMINNGIVFVPLDIAQQALNIGNGVSLFALKTASGNEDKITKALMNSFKEKNLDLKAYSWRESAASVIALSAAKKGGAATILSVVLLIGMIGIDNNVILSALERTGEIGMMKALGMREWEIVFVFMVEATGIGILGGLAGCLIGFAGVGLMAKYGFDLSYMGGDMSEFGIPILDKIYGTWNIPAFGFLFILSVMVALLSSIVPAYWAAHKDPVKAIYHR